MKERNNRRIVTELAAAVQGYDGYADRKERLQTDHMIRGYLYNKLVKSRAVTERTLTKLLNTDRFDDAPIFESMGRGLLRMAISVKNRSYRSCRIFSDSAIDEKTFETLCSCDLHCVDRADEIARFFRSFSKQIMSGKLTKDGRRYADIDEMMYADYSFDELTMEFDTVLVQRDYLIMEAEKHPTIIGSP